MVQNQIPVLIVGAGPTGLVLALWLTKIGVKVRIVDKTEKAGTTSRALIVHSRTLEYYRQLGIAEKLIERAYKFTAVNLWIQGTNRARVPIGDIGEGISPFPFLTIFPQDRHEELLLEELTKLGVEVERKVELLAIDNGSESVKAQLRHADGREETCSALYLAGCDGARSTVRRELHQDFPGGTYPDVYYVADIVADGPAINGELHVSLDEAEFLAIFPMKGQGRARLVGVVPHGEEKENPQWNDISKAPIQLLKLNIQQVKWFSTYHVHHRVAEHFQEGRTFLLGDAGHLHSPVGGQGMNTGIGDAVNLAWKLGEVLHARASADILKTYEVERIAFAKKLVSTTDRAFRFVSSEGFLAKIVRTKWMPVLIPFLLKSERVKRFMYRTVSQTAIEYRMSPLSEAGNRQLHGGDRLPWIGSNYDPLASLSWQIHIYGNLPEARTTSLEKLNIPVRSFPWSEEMSNQGFQEKAACLIRPDGYIALVSPTADAQEIQRYLMRHRLTFS